MTEPGGRGSTTRPEMSPRFRELLRADASADGFVPFDRFMDLALYAEGVGFYTRPESPFGRAGDYYTAAHVSPLFGRTIAERIREVARSLPDGVPWRVLELGPGDGTLGEGVVEGLGSGPGSLRPPEYVLVDRSAALSARAYERVSARGRAMGVSVRASGGIGADGPFYGVVLANEVLDAQPARRLQWDGKRWLELGVRVADDGRVVAASAPVDRPVPPPKLPPAPAPGTVVEFSPMAEGLLREAADHLVAGLVLILDYGMEEAELLAAHPSGTLATVRRHRESEDPYSEPGSSDLSVFVNFGRVRAAAARAGLREVAFRRQAEALGAWGLPRLLEEAHHTARSPEEEVRLRLAVKNLLFGFERFAALELVPPGSAGRSSTAT